MKVTVSQTLSKSTEIIAKDDDNLTEKFREQHWDIPSLLGILREYLEYDLRHLNRKREASTKMLLEQLESCKNWTTDEFEVIRE